MVESEFFKSKGIVNADDIHESWAKDGRISGFEPVTEGEGVVARFVHVVVNCVFRVIVHAPDADESGVVLKYNCGFREVRFVTHDKMRMA